MRRASRALAYAWAALESLRYFALMRRRERVGLASAVSIWIAFFPPAYTRMLRTRRRSAEG